MSDYYKHKALPCAICGETPEIEAGGGADGFATYYLEHDCYKNKENRYRYISFSISASDDNMYALISEWNQNYTNYVICPDCEGSGRSSEHDRSVPPASYTCETCSGVGMITKKDLIKNFGNHLLELQKPLDPEILDVLNEYFWELL